MFAYTLIQGVRKGFLAVQHTLVAPLFKWLTLNLEDQQPRGGIAALDGVRALACLTVLAYHINLITRDTGLWVPAGKPVVAAVALAGGSGVTLFFVLSGFLLFLPYAKSLLFETSWPNARQFYLRRALRIIPAYYLTLFLLVVLSKPEFLQPAHLKDLGLFMLFLMDAPATYMQINGPFWTLAVEWQFYLLLPLLALGFRLLTWRLPPAWRLWGVLTCLAALVIWGLGTRYLGIYYSAHPRETLLVSRSVLDVLLFWVYGSTGKYLEVFSIGMLLGLLYILLSRSESKNGLMLWVRRLGPWLWGLGLLVLLLMSLWHFNQTYHTWSWLEALFAYHDWFNTLGFALGFGLCILGVLFGPVWLGRLFARMPLRWLGLISYSLYMWHLPLLLVFMQQVGYNLHGVHPYVVYSLYWLWALLVIIPFSLIFYMLAERPGMRLSARLRRPGRPSSPSSS